MKIVIVGYGEMLQALIMGVLKTKHEIVGVLRHDKVLLNPLSSKINDFLKPSMDYNLVKTLRLNDINVKSVNSPEFRSELKRLKVDLVLVGSWSEKFSMQTINTPKYGCVNTHPSLLPKYRGPNPYIHVLLNNEKESGITFHSMDVNYDTGSILHQATVNVQKNDTGMSLKLRCCDLAQQEVVSLLKDFKKKLSKPKSQNEKIATYQHQLHLSECILNFEKETTTQIDRRIRALTPWTKTFIPYKNQFLEFETYKIYNKPCDKSSSQIIRITEKSIFIVCADKKVIEFSGLKFKLPLLNLFGNFVLHKFVKLNSKAV